MLEYLRGGQFLDHLHTIGNKYSEQQAAALFAQVWRTGGGSLRFKGLGF